MQVINVSQGPIFEISPTKAASAFSIGRNRKAMATPEAKTMAVKASIGNFVLISKSQIRIIPKITKGKAPKETSKPYKRAKAMPGKVKCPRGPATKLILLDNINVPKYPATPPIKIPAIKLNKNCSIILVSMMLVKFHFFAVKLLQDLGI